MASVEASVTRSRGVLIRATSVAVARDIIWCTAAAMIGLSCDGAYAVGLMRSLCVGRSGIDMIAIAHEHMRIMPASSLAMLVAALHSVLGSSECGAIEQLKRLPWALAAFGGMMTMMEAAVGVLGTTANPATILLASVAGMITVPLAYRLVELVCWSCVPPHRKRLQ